MGLTTTGGLQAKIHGGIITRHGVGQDSAYLLPIELLPVARITGHLVDLLVGGGLRKDDVPMSPVRGETLGSGLGGLAGQDPTED